jgi:hypothetical protein
LFEMLEGANHTVSLHDLARAPPVRCGLRRQRHRGTVRTPAGCGEVPAPAVGGQARLVRPVEPGGYFAHEPVATWGINAFWDCPSTRPTPYYRTFETAVSADAHLYEFVVPMVPPSWNEPDRVAAFRAVVEEASAPTAVAVSTIDISRPATDHDSTDYYEH